MLEKRIYGKNYKVVLDENNQVIWGCGRVPWDKYTPNKDLIYWNYGGTYWFTNEKCIDSTDYGKRGQPFIRHVSWILSMYNEGRLYNEFFNYKS